MNLGLPKTATSKEWQPHHFVLFLLLVAGCNAQEVTFPHFESCSISPAQQLTFKSGSTSDNLTTLSPRGMVQLVAGFQGGYHINISAESSLAADSGEAKLLINLCQNGHLIGRGREQFVDAQSKAGLQTGLAYIYLLHDYQPEQVAGDDAEILGLLIDSEGNQWAGSLPVTPKCCASLLDPE